MTTLDAQAAGKLRFVEVPEGPVDTTDFPTFLIVGPQRTGTTWLFSQLQQHPEIWGAKKKEIYYFNNLRSRDAHPDHLPEVDPTLEWYLDHFRPSASEVEQRNAQCRQAFGCDFEQKQWGEATATYAVAFHQKRRLFDDLLLLNPNVKIVLMVRDPVERAWSHAKKHFVNLKKNRVEDVPEADWREFLSRSYQLMCGRYSEFVPTWQERIAPERFLLGRFLDVQERPRELLRGVLEFLGVRSDDAVLEPAGEGKQNKTPRADIPFGLRDYLEEQFAGEQELLRSRNLI